MKKSLQVQKWHCAKMLGVNRGKWRNNGDGRDGGRCGQKASLSKNPRLSVSVYADVFFSTSSHFFRETPIRDSQFF